jgi:prevent-host-death family protein
MTKIMKASEFKAKCLAVIDEVAASGQGVVVTKNGKPLVELVPHKPKAKRSPFGILKGDLVIKGDIMSPIDVEWDAMKLSCSTPKLRSGSLQRIPPSAS